MITGPVSAASAEPAAFKPTSTRGGYDITLITGDRVHVTEMKDGRKTATVTPAPRAGGDLPAGFRMVERGGDLSVIPADMAGLIPQRLDPELFNVTSLAEQGFTDTRSRSLPLIISYKKRATRSVIPAVKPLRTLESINATAVSLDRRQARQFGADLSRLAGSARTAAANPLAGVEKIWLDQKAKAIYDHRAPRVPERIAGAAEYDGSGTTVAVLDSGIDSTHPDLSGKVVDARDFTGSGTADDQLGPGTHIAGIIAGSGAASNGQFKGVAPGAKLLNGRVLNANGEFTLSGLVDAMEWAAKGHRADVVNLSFSVGVGELGGLVTPVVNTLSQVYGTLFVVSAGNDGCEACVGSPGDSPAALTVGAVDADDKLASFSSYGPIGTERAVKPDLTAPGVGVVAARAHGTSAGQPVDDSYTRLSGTNTAAPYVAGAAALMKEARPGIKSNEVKALLMGAAKSSADTPVEKQGAGRVDVAASLDEPVVASSGSENFGLVVKELSGPVNRTVTYRNTSTAPVTLELSASGAFTVSPATLSLPAGGEGQVQVTLEPAKAEAKFQREELIATVQGGPSTRTLLTGNVELKRAKLRMSGIARDGRPARVTLNVLNVENGALDGVVLPYDRIQYCSDPGDPNLCLLVPPGTYSVFGNVATMRPDVDSLAWETRGDVLNESLVGDPELKVTGDTNVVLDARKAVEVKIKTPDHKTARNFGAATKLAMTRSPVKGPALHQDFLSTGNVEERFFIQPTKRVTKGGFTAATRWRLEAPAITMKTPGIALDPQYYDPVYFSDLSTEYPRFNGSAQLQVVDAGRGRPEDLEHKDLRGRLALIRRTSDIPVSTQANNAAAAGARVVAIYSDRPGVDATAGGYGVKLNVPTVRLSQEEGLRLLDRMHDAPVSVQTNGVTVSPYVYDLYLAETGRVRDTLDYVVRKKSLAEVKTHFYSEATGDLTASEVRSAWEPGATFALDVLWPVMGAPRTRTDYITADPDVQWSGQVVTPELPVSGNFPHPVSAVMVIREPEQRSYEAGQRTDVSWFKHPVAPGVSPLNPLRRTDDVLHVDLQGFVDASGHIGSTKTDFFPGGMRTDLRIFMDGELRFRTSDDARGEITSLSADKTSFRFEYDTENHSWWSRLSTRTRTAWSFTTERPATGTTTVVPILLAAFDTPVDLQNRSSSSRLGLRLYRQPGAAEIPIKSVALEVSYDDGATWRPVSRLRGKGAGAYEATLDQRPATGFVSLRVKAADAQGNALSQEVIRAYALR